MPRPLRSRVASAQSAAARTATTSSDAEQAPNANTRAQSRGGRGRGGNDPPSDATSDIYGVSDRELKRVASLRNTRNAAAVISGANPQQARALDESRQRRDEALSLLDDLSSTTAGAQSSDRKRSPSPAVERGRRAASTATTRQSSIRDASHLDVLDDDDDIFGDLEGLEDADLDISSLDGNSERVAGGSRSADTSSINVALFKRGRSRQSSVVGRDHAPIRPSSRGPNTPGLSSTLNLGVFKRRAREPSILGTGRKPYSERGGNSEVENDNNNDKNTEGSADEGSDLERADDGPDAESTPLDRRRTRGSALPRVSSAGSRKRKSTDGQEGSSKRPALASSDDVRESVEPNSVDDVDEHTDSGEEQSLPRQDAIIPSTPVRRGSDGGLIIAEDDSILAPPASSGSSEGSPAYWPSMRNLARRQPHQPRRAPSKARKAPVPGDDDDDDDEDGVSGLSSPPSLTHSPNYPDPKERGKGGRGGKKPAARGGSRAREPSPILTTAELTSMLPRRRIRPRMDDSRDTEDDDDGGDDEAGDVDRSSVGGADEDDDELSLPRGRRRHTRLLGANSNTAGTRLTACGKQQQQQQQQLQQRQQQPNKARSNRRTYGSRSFTNNSDKENQDEAGGGGEGDSIEVAAYDDNNDAEDSDVLPDDTFDATEVGSEEGRATVGNELRLAAKKFKEVDKWELEYEEVTEPSSPPGIFA